jgi:ubiquinone/menaquinone biosynthesis C-methylase UbiE
MDNPWVTVSAADYERHMEHESVRQGEMIRKHLAGCLERFRPESLLYLGAGVGNGLESARASRLRDILAVDVNAEYLAILRDRFGTLGALRTDRCSFPEGFRDAARFDLAYGALFFEYVDLESALSTVGAHLARKGHLAVLLQQPSEQGHMTSTGVTALEAVVPIMSLRDPAAFVDVADRAASLVPVSTEHLVSPCGKPFCEIILQRA